MWLAFAIGAFLSLLGIIGLYIREYWDDFHYEGKHQGTFRYWKGEEDTVVMNIGILTPSQGAL